MIEAIQLDDDDDNQLELLVVSYSLALRRSQNKLALDERTLHTD